MNAPPNKPIYLATLLTASVLIVKRLTHRSRYVYVPASIDSATSGPHHRCSPLGHGGCNVCAECCYSYIAGADMCSECARQRCN